MDSRANDVVASGGTWGGMLTKPSVFAFESFRDLVEELLHVLQVGLVRLETGPLLPRAKTLSVRVEGDSELVKCVSVQNGKTVEGRVLGGDLAQRMSHPLLPSCMLIRVDRLADEAVPDGVEVELKVFRSGDRVLVPLLSRAVAGWESLCHAEECPFTSRQGRKTLVEGGVAADGRARRVGRTSGELEGAIESSRGRGSA